MDVLDFYLVCKARSGDSNAFGKLYDRHGQRIYNLLVRLTGDRTQAEDLTQETFLNAYRSLSMWRGSGSFSAWLCGIAVHCFHRNRPPFEEPLDESAVAGNESDPLAAYTQQERQAALKAVIAELPDLYRETFLLVYVEGFAYKEVAHLLNIPVGTVQSRLNRAKRLLQDRLPQLLPDLAHPAAPPVKGVNSHVL